jgi:hypothetical protein
MQSNGRRRTPGIRAVAALAALACGCSDVSPLMDRNYVRVGAPVLWTPVRVDPGRDDGPFPGGSVSIGTLFQQSLDHETGIEAEYAYNGLAPGGDLEGYSHGFYSGVHRAWNPDGRIRPSIGLGGEWQTIHVHHNPSGTDPHGFGIYGDVGLEYMITDFHSIGVRLRDAPIYDFASGHNGIRNNIELSLIAVWRF